MSTENALLTILIERINNDSLVLPTLPEAALRVRKAADDPNTNLNKMVEVIAQDPALSARMIRVANSAFMGRSVKVETLSQAVTRIGLIQIKNIATAMAMEQLFVSRNDLVKEYLETTWSRTVEVAAVAVVTMQEFLRNNRRSHLRQDTITLAGLIHNIGVLPILTEAERHEEVFASPDFLEHAIQKLSGIIGGKILKAWGFTEEFREISEKWRDMSYKVESPSYIDFVRIGAIFVLTGPDTIKRNKRLEQYVEKGLILDMDYFESTEFFEDLGAVKTLFS